MTGPGSQIGPFHIERELGRGAVGIVYLAHDTKLDRQVAIKSLPAEVMANPKARLRFSREAKLLASLNHTNIAAIHGLEASNGVDFLVLELVPGETLAARIARGPIPVDEAREIASRIADALEAAHEQGIVHRDLKPANIKLTEDGTVKVLDFGLAKAWETGNVDSSLSPTLTQHATIEGVITDTITVTAKITMKNHKVGSVQDSGQGAISVDFPPNTAPVLSGGTVSPAAGTDAAEMDADCAARGPRCLNTLQLKQESNWRTGSIHYSWLPTGNTCRGLPGLTATRTRSHCPRSQRVIRRLNGDSNPMSR